MSDVKLNIPNISHIGPALNVIKDMRERLQSLNLLSEDSPTKSTTPFLDKMREVRRRRRKPNLKVKSEDLIQQIRKVTQSQSKILKKIEETRRSRLQSSDSIDSLGRRYSGESRDSSQKVFSRIPSFSKITSDRTLTIQDHAAKTPSKIPRAQMLKSLKSMNIAKSRIREKIDNYARPADIIEKARKIEKISRCREVALKSVPPLTNKAMQMENHINNSLIGSIKAKMSLLTELPLR